MWKCDGAIQLYSNIRVIRGQDICVLFLHTPKIWFEIC